LFRLALGDAIVLPTLIVNPNSDQTFLTRVEEAAADSRSPRDLETALRRDFPRVVVRARDLAGETNAVWYVYREGRWIPEP
jgi:hypothetical protein